MSTISNYIFDDGSIESKVLQFELIGQDVKVIKVKPYTKLDDWLAEIIEEDDNIKRIFLHFCFEDYALSEGPDYRAEIARAHHLYPNLRIVMQYEQADRASIKRRASNYGISLKEDLVSKDDINKLIEENKEKAQIIDYGKYSVGGEVTEVPPAKESVSDEIIKELRPDDDPITKRINAFKDKRRRKKPENKNK